MKASLQTPGLCFYSFHQALPSSRSVFTRVAALHFKTEDEYFAMNSDMDGETLGGISMWIHLQSFLLNVIVKYYQIETDS